MEDTAAVVPGAASSAAAVPPAFPLAHGLEALVAQRPHIDPHWHPSLAGSACPLGADFDLVIVGSGYGAAVAARQLAGCRPQGRPGDAPLSICILERGQEYAAGAFPSRLADLAGHVRFNTPSHSGAKGRRNGLFDLRVGGDVQVLVANGVGGGSLINAGVMLRPTAAVLRQPHWPAALRQPGALDEHFEAVLPWLGAVVAGQPNALAAAAAPAKSVAMQRLAGTAGAQAVPITMALQTGTHSVAGVPLAACIGCGDCATGCNHGAKHSLDIGLLAQACHTPGVQMHTGATVLWLERATDGDGWLLRLQHTDSALRRGQPQPFRLRARRVVLAAGTLGSTEILQRSQQQGLALSAMLGQRFSANGDLVALLHNTGQPVLALAEPQQAPARRGVGPTITRMIDRRDGAAGFVVQDLAVPAALQQAFSELFTSAHTLQGLTVHDHHAHQAGDADPCAVDAAALRRALPLAMIGHDGANGQLQLRQPPADAQAAGQRGGIDDGDGALQIVWPDHRLDRRWPQQHAQLLAMAAAPAGLGGQLLPNPVWQLLPPALQRSLGLPHGPLLTVHPLGGCVMADSVDQGVVDGFGRVFDPSSAGGSHNGLHPGLAVLDGAAVPGSLGINPALTIAALAHRAAAQLRLDWGLAAPQPATLTLGPRPPQRQVPNPTLPPPSPQPTEVELLERLSAETVLADGRPAWLELTLQSQPTTVASLVQRSGPRTLQFDGRHSRLRILSQAPQRHSGEPAFDSEVLLSARIDGVLSLFQREPSAAWPRSLRASVHWLHNRGLRDLLQRPADRPHDGPRAGPHDGPRAGPHDGPRADPPDAPGDRPGPARRAMQVLRQTLALASHAGGVRRLDYTMRISAAQGPLAALLPDGTHLHGAKRLHYNRAASPLQQLMELRLDHIAPLARGQAPLLCLDLGHLARQGVPLLRLVGQQDQPSALADLASLAAYAARLLVDSHLWSFRQPDPPQGRQPQRLPAAVPGAPPPHRRYLQVARYHPAPGHDSQREHQRAADGSLPVHICLTRYRPADADASLPPVLLIHGYSASGTTFAHPAVQPGLMRHLCSEHRRDVWVLDMRSSCGMPTASHDWAFEDMGCEDIPVAVDFVCRATRAPQLDIVAHCMGAAMLFMGLLGRQSPAGRAADGPRALQAPSLGQHERRRHKLWDRELTQWAAAPLAAGASRAVPQGRIRRLVMSQVGPALLLTPANTARAVLMRWGRQLMASGTFAFTPDKPGLADQLLDRLLCALPYPAGEFERENPFWPPGAQRPWVGTRHRIDALFGRVFNLAGMDDAVLDRLDDFFGPFSISTVSQVMHFARHGQITDRSGFNRFVDPRRLAERLNFPMLSLHAAANGLADPGTASRLEALLRDNHGPDGSFLPQVLAGDSLGHQDSLIGTEAATRPARLAIAAFLQQPDAAP